MIMSEDPARPDPVAAVAALQEPTRRRLYELVVGRDSPVSRDEAAEALGIGRPIAAFHLDRLAAVGLLATAYQRTSGRSGPGAGRPAKVYRRGPAAIDVSLPARRYELAAALFADALDEAGPVELADRARARGRALGEQARTAVAGQPKTGQPDTALVSTLARGGYEPRVEGDMILLRNCPFDALVDRHRQLTCGMNLALLEGIRDGLGETERTPRPVTIPGFCCVAFGPAERGADTPE